MTYPKNAHKKSPVVKESAKPQIIELLTKKPMTTREIGVLVDRHHESVAKILREMGEGKCHICGWAGEYAIWTMHPGKHVPRPATPKSIRERVSRKKRSQVDYLNCNYVKSVRLPWELVPVQFGAQA